LCSPATGDVLEPEHGLAAIGSGGAYAQELPAPGPAAQYRLSRPAEIVKKSLEIAGDLCIYTNQNHLIESCKRRRAGRPRFGFQAHTLRYIILMSATTMTPGEIVSELDKNIVGQDRAKRSVAVALRNRWRRQQVAEPLRHEIVPKNILMIGPTGVGKTEIARPAWPNWPMHRSSRSRRPSSL